MGGVSYSVAVAGRLPVAQQRGWEGRVLGATRRRTCSAVEAPGTVWPPACRRKSQPQSPLRTSATLCIVSLERDGEGNFCTQGGRSTRAPHSHRYASQRNQTGQQLDSRDLLFSMSSLRSPAAVDLGSSRVFSSLIRPIRLKSPELPGPKTAYKPCIG